MPQTRLTWYGQSAYKIVTPTGKVLLIDPWFTNPKNPNGKSDIAALDRVDVICITHGHGDHIGDMVEIGKKTGAKLLATNDLAMVATTALGYPADQAGGDTCGFFGGDVAVLDGEAVTRFVPAFHGGAIAKEEGSVPVFTGPPAGLVISLRDSITLYHTGDTDVFSDMALVSPNQKVDVMLACIGDHFTMGPARAAMAVKLVQPRVVIPMHYGTFPLLTGTPEAFAAELEKAGTDAELRVMNIGETLTF